MNIYYAKTILYAYPCVETLLNQIDEIVEKRAMASMTNFSPAEEQCEKILALIRQKDTLINMKLMVDDVLKKFTQEEMDCLDYKYFRFRKKEDFKDFDSSSRGYFRRQIRIADKFALRIEKKGITDAVFEKEYLSMPFFSELIKRVIEHETNSKKNKSKKGTTMLVKSIIPTKLPHKRYLERTKNTTVSVTKINNYS